MCGIVGLFDTRGKREFDRQLLGRMNQIQAHRGPDEGELYIEPGIGLGHRRLSIMDVSSGQQPLFNEDGSIVVIFNGEIYNFEGLAAELAGLGHIFRTHCDTEVIVHAWEEWGEDCVDRFGACSRLAYGIAIGNCCFLRATGLASSRFTIACLGMAHSFLRPSLRLCLLIRISFGSSTHTLSKTISLMVTSLNQKRYFGRHSNCHRLIH